MPDEQQPAPQVGRASAADDNPGMDPVNPVAGTGGGGPGGREAGTGWIVALSLYLVLFTLFVIYSLVKIWPVPTPSRNEPPTATASPSPRATASPSPSPSPSPAIQTPSPVAPRTSPASTQVSLTPSPTPSPSPTPTPVQPSPVTVLGWTFDIWDEQRLLLLVIFGGALGTLVHSLRSVYWYVGNRNLVIS